MAAAEFSRPIDVRQADGRAVHLAAGEDERGALAARFAIVRVDRLEADLRLDRDGRTVAAEGEFAAEIVQTCAVSGEDLPVSIREPIALRFVPRVPRSQPDEEIELDAEDCDEIEYDGHVFDLGEAVAQSLALAIDPFATGPQAEEARHSAGLLDPDDSGPFAALKGLKIGKDS